MSGMNDNIAAMGSWSPANPSPRTLMSNFLNEEFDLRPFAGFLAENGSERNAPMGGESGGQKVFGYPKEEGNATGGSSSNEYHLEHDLFDGNLKLSPHGGLSERIAASGFSLPKLHVGPIEPSEMVMIPAGLSPTSLLDSPIFLSNSMAQPSPTTGKFQCGENNNMSPVSTSLPAKDEENLFEGAPEAFAFKPPQESNFSFFINAEKRVVPNIGQQQELPSIKVSVQSGRPVQNGNIGARSMNFHSQQDINLQAESKDATDQKRSDSFVGSDHSPPLDDQPDGEADAKGELSSMALGTPAEDGYNWRKYGQKQVKGSEYPRSYYKCTHLNCQVKKKVERSHEGHITEIIYKGAHNHPKPPPNRRAGVPSSHPFNDQQLDGLEQPGSQANFDNKPLWASAQNGGQNWHGDILEATSSAMPAPDTCDPSTSVQQNQDVSRLSADAVDASSTMSNDEDEDDRATHGSVSLGCDGEVDETESKRRKLEACAIEMSAASRAVREPRVVVQTTSEVDILDDGYRWRKYGQKVVKGNPNPRSYYKCTNPGCTVRKHVERASHDLKSVITTYEGKHNHEVPAARSSGHQGSAPSTNTTATSATQPHSLIRRPEPGQDGLVRFDGHTPLSAFGLSGREPLVPAAGFSFMAQPGFANFPMAGLGPVSQMKMPVLPPVYPFVGHHQSMEGGFVAPKGEPKEEPTAEQRLQLRNGSVYQQMIGRLPLGPQL